MIDKGQSLEPLPHLLLHSAGQPAKIMWGKSLDPLGTGTINGIKILFEKLLLKSLKLLVMLEHNPELSISDLLLHTTHQLAERKTSLTYKKGKKCWVTEYE